MKTGLEQAPLERLMYRVLGPIMIILGFTQLVGVKGLWSLTYMVGSRVWTIYWYNRTIHSRMRASDTARMFMLLRERGLRILLVLMWGLIMWATYAFPPHRWYETDPIAWFLMFTFMHFVTIPMRGISPKQKEPEPAKSAILVPATLHT